MKSQTRTMKTYQTYKVEATEQEYTIEDGCWILVTDDAKTEVVESVETRGELPSPDDVYLLEFERGADNECPADDCGRTFRVEWTGPTDLEKMHTKVRYCPRCGTRL